MITNKQALREELSNPAIGTNAHLRKLALALLDEMEAKDKRIAELEVREVSVTLPKLHVGVVQDGHAVMVPYAAGHWFNKTAILEMLAATGITVKEGGK
ncbi:MAG TPA: hypothetical protein VGN40_07855 [Lelliottia sp.]|jgi:hypothetical protein